jgi:hypothetical protein
MYFAKHFKALRDGKADPLVDLSKDMRSPSEEPDQQATRTGQAMRLAAQRPDRVTLEMCLSCAAIALGCIMAGTGDVACLRFIREARWKVEKEVGSLLSGACDRGGS